VIDFDGINYTGWFPPDPVVAAGKEHLVCCVNSAFAIYNKETGEQEFATSFSLWFSLLAPPGHIVNPRIIYDNHEERFVILALSTDFDNQESAYMIAVSDDDNPLGNWWIYKLDATVNGTSEADNWANFPGLGYDYSGAVYITSDQYDFASSFDYVKLRILQKSELYAGNPVTWVDFWNLMDADGALSTSVKPAEVMTQ
jgi:hypothetical protein